MRIEKCMIQKTVRPADLNSGDRFFLKEYGKYFILLKLPDCFQEEYLAIEEEQSENNNIAHNNFYLHPNDNLLVEVEHKEMLSKMEVYQLFLEDGVVYMKFSDWSSEVRNMLTGEDVWMNGEEYVLCKIV